MKCEWGPGGRSRWLAAGGRAQEGRRGDGTGREGWGVAKRSCAKAPVQIDASPPASLLPNPTASHCFRVPSRARPFPCAALLWLQFCGIRSSFLRLFLSASVLRKGGERSHAFSWLLLLGCLFFDPEYVIPFVFLVGRIDCSLFVAVVWGWGGGPGEGGGGTALAKGYAIPRSR
ncbi:unnamed protein product [Sphagnum troendelagicum]